MDQINEQKQLVRDYQLWDYLGCDLYGNWTLEDYIEYIKDEIMEEGWEGIESRRIGCYDCRKETYYLYKTRLETDEELAFRIQDEKKKREAQIKKENRERRAYEKLKKKYENT